MRLCGCAAAVANALPIVKECADIRLDADHGAGVVELIDTLTRDDGSLIRPERHGIRLGVDRSGNDVLLAPHRGGILIAGGSGVGKSTIATALTEHMAERRIRILRVRPRGRL